MEGEGDGQDREWPTRDYNNGSSDTRSRLSGAGSGMAGGATAVVAIVTKVGEVLQFCHWLLSCPGGVHKLVYYHTTSVHGFFDGLRNACGFLIVQKS